jgi:pimeloyl-ACP methyl ester carboxylesterase
MLVDLVETTAADGLRLDGALHLPEHAAAGQLAKLRPDVDAVLVVHGTGSNFYGSRFLTAIAERAASQWGAAALVANTRGHDQIGSALVRNADGSTGSRTVGSAFEFVDECRFDIAAWVGLLHERGYRRIVVIGHSLGAVKTVYAAVELAAAGQPLLGVVALAAVSPPRLSYSHFAASVRGPGFLEEVAAAERHVAEGRPQELMSIRFPLPYVITAESYLDKYGPAERYNLLKLVDRLPLPTLFTFGSQEVLQGIAFREFPDELVKFEMAGTGPSGTGPKAAPLKTAVIGGGDHHYTGVQGVLLDTIERWLRKLPKEEKST